MKSEDNVVAGEQGLSWPAFLLKRLLRFLLLLYLGLCVTGLLSDYLIFQPHLPGGPPSPDLIRFQSSDGVELTGRFYECPGARYTLLFSHGNAEDIADLDRLFCALTAPGGRFSLFAYDYRGFGHSAGSPSVAGVEKDSDAAFATLTGRLGVPPERVVLHGRSVGGGPTCHLLTRGHKVAGVVLESTFTSAFAVALPFPILPFDRFPNLARLRSYEGPVLVIHGREDRVIPFAHGERLYTDAKGDRRSLFLDGVGHNDLVVRRFGLYKKSLESFIESLER